MSCSWTTATPTWSLRGGFLGVDVFLVLSGFLIGGILIREAADSGTIDGSRFAPWAHATPAPSPLLALVVIQASVSIALGSGWVEQARQIVLSLTFTANWQMSFGHQPPLEVLHLWSLSLEVQNAPARGPGRVGPESSSGPSRSLVIGLSAAAVSGGVLAVVPLRGRYSPRRALYERTDTRLDSLLLGIAGVVVWRSRLLGDTVLRVAGIVGLAALAACWWFVEPTDAWLYRGGFTLIALASVAAVMAATTGGGVVAWLADRRWLRWVGGISFSLYLWHLPIYVWTVRIWPAVPLWAAAHHGAGQLRGGDGQLPLRRVQGARPLARRGSRQQLDALSGDGVDSAAAPHQHPGCDAQSVGPALIEPGHRRD